MSQRDRSHFKVVPDKLNRQMLRLTSVDMLVIGFLGVLTILLEAALDLMGVLLGIAIAFVVLDQQNYARNYDYVLFKYPQALYQRYAKKGFFWKQGDRRSVLPYRIKELPGTDIALVYGDEDENSVSVIIEGEGSNMYSVSLDQMRNIQDELADDLIKVASNRHWDVEIGYLLRLRQWDPSSLESYEARAFTTDVLLPLKLVASHGDVLTEADELAMEQYLYTQELKQEFIDQGATTPTMAVVVTIHRKGRGKHKKTPIYEDEVASQPIIEIAHRAAGLLASRGVQGLKILDVTGARRYYREAWDAVSLTEFRRELASGELSDTGHWPQEEIWGDTTEIKTDATHHALIQITGTASPVGPLYMRQIFGAPLGNDGRTLVPHRTVSMVTQTMRSRREYLITGFVIDMIEGIRDYAGLSRMRPGAAAKDEERRKREQSAYDNPYTQLYNIFVVISAATKRELEAQVHAQLEYYDTCKTVQSVRVNTLEPILYRLTWRAISGVM